ncbi:MAG TPA: biotin transporter BioY [Candidatus Limnocylindrales bacterium]|nr:biotin transporter BioY [Candidatus Limnocylindrales bacterium]
MLATTRWVRVPPFERGLTLGDFLVPIRVGERATSRQRHLIMVLAGTLLIVLGARISFYVPPNFDVPVSLQTFSVLFGGALLGFRRAIGSVVLYIALGLVGLPVFAYSATTGDYASGMATIASYSNGSLMLGATGGYIIGFLIAAGLVGRLAELGWDRHIGGSIGAMILGNAVIYLIGVPWLMVARGFDLQVGLQYGLWPFVVGDAIKLALAAGLLPVGWWAVQRGSNER